MCGIFAAIKTGGFFQPGDEDTFTKSTDLIAYRGPDQRGIRTLNTLEGTGDNGLFNVFLGHRRLSIIDLSEGGNQPMERDDCIIVYNGEIFNYLELRKELQNSGVTFTGESDTEVILRTYQIYGSSGFSRFNGMWAFILIDLKKNLAICSRDRFSIKPFYYHRDGSSWYFASEIKQLLPFVRHRKLNTKVAYQFLRQQLLEHTNTSFFEGIEKIPAKSTLHLDLLTGTHKLEQYWDFEPEQPPTNERDIIDRFRFLLDDSIGIRLRSDVDVGGLLSGGLDSSAIAVLADARSAGRFSTFSVVSDERDFSEERFIDMLVKHRPHLNIKLRLQSESIPEILGKVLFHQDQPFASLSVVAQYLMFQHIRKEYDIKVILSGQGGDEVMMGYLKYYFFNLMENRRKHHYGKILRELAGSLFNRTVLWQLGWNEVRRYLPGFAGSAPTFFHLQGETEPVWKMTSLRERQQLDIDRFSVPALAHYEDRNSMAASIESRLPFLDHRLVNFLLGLPVEMKMKNGWTKYVLRKSIDELPAGIRWRRDKQGFTTPESIWLKNQLQPIVRNTFQTSSLADAGLLDKKGFMEYYQDFLNDKPGINPSLIFRTMIFEQWYKMHFS